MFQALEHSLQTFPMQLYVKRNNAYVQHLLLQHGSYVTASVHLRE